MGLYTIKTFLSRKNVNSRLHNFHKILAKKMKMIYKVFYRSVAQPGSALVWGASGHGFKSRHSDQKHPLTNVRGLFLLMDMVGE